MDAHLRAKPSRGVPHAAIGTLVGFDLLHTLEDWNDGDTIYLVRTLLGDDFSRGST